MKRASLLFLLASCTSSVPFRAVQLGAPRHDPDLAALGIHAILVPAAQVRSADHWARVPVADRETGLRAVRALPRCAGVVLEGLESAAIDDERTRVLFGLLVGAEPEERPEEWKSFRPVAVAHLVKELRAALPPGTKVAAWISAARIAEAERWGADVLIVEGGVPAGRVVSRDGAALRTRGLRPVVWAAVPFSAEAVRRARGADGLVLTGYEGLGADRAARIEAVRREIE